MSFFSTTHHVRLSGGIRVALCTWQCASSSAFIHASPSIGKHIVCACGSFQSATQFRFWNDWRSGWISQYSLHKMLCHIVTPGFFPTFFGVIEPEESNGPMLAMSIAKSRFWMLAYACWRQESTQQRGIACLAVLRCSCHTCSSWFSSGDCESQKLYRFSDPMYSIP